MTGGTRNTAGQPVPGPEQAAEQVPGGVASRIGHHPRWCQGGRHHDDLLIEHTASVGVLPVGAGFVEVCLVQCPDQDPRIGVMAGEDVEGTAWNLVDLRPFDAHTLQVLLTTAAMAVQEHGDPAEHPWWCWRRNHLVGWPEHSADAGEIIEGDAFVQVAMVLHGDTGQREVSICVGEDRAEGDGAWLRMAPGQARQLAELVDVAVVLAMAEAVDR